MAAAIDFVKKSGVVFWIVAAFATIRLGYFE